MRLFILDTGIAGLYVTRRRGVYARAQIEAARGNRVGICVPVLGELYAGVEGSATRAHNLLLLERALASLRVWPYTTAAAEEYGRLDAYLRGNGRLIQQVDVQIAAIAFTLGNCTVVTTDSDFAAVPGLSVESWATP